MKTKLMMTAIASFAALSATSANAQDCSTGINSHTVYYNHNSAQTTAIQNQLDTIVNAANSCGASSIQVVCHTDTTGPQSYNQALSERRAVDVMNELVSRGVSQSIISTSGQGELNNAVDRGDNVREELNRRCEFTTTYQAAFEAPQQEVYQNYEPVQETYVETVSEPVYTQPEPIQQVVEEYVAPQVYTPAPAPTPVAPAPAPAPTPTPTPLPTVSGTGFGGISAPIIVAGLGALAAGAIIIFDDDDDDDAVNSPE